MSDFKPVLLNFPDQFESERLLIRAPRAGDGKAINEAIIESFNELNIWMPWAREKPTLQDSEEACRRSAARFIAREDLQLLLFSKSTGELVGSSGLHRFDWSVPKFEIGYWCRTSQTGKGYISEAVSRIARFAFDHLKAERIEIHCDSGNYRSSKIPERLGFQLEGILRNHARDPRGALRDTRVYSIVSANQLTDNQKACEKLAPGNSD